jgi:hypothetical protein
MEAADLLAVVVGMEALNLGGAGPPQLAPTGGPWCRRAGWRATGRAAPPVLPTPLLRRGATARATDGRAGLREAPGRSTGPAPVTGADRRQPQTYTRERVCEAADGTNGAGV